MTFILGTTEPDATNVGIIPGSTLTVWNGDITMTAGQTLSDLIINGRVTVNVANATITNCIIRGQNSAPTTGVHLIDAMGAGCSNLLVQNCEIYAQYPHWLWGDGIVGHDFTLQYSNIHHVTDCVGIFNTHASIPYNTNVTIQGCYLHDLTWWTAATTGVVHPSDTETHNDCVQQQGGHGTVMVGNRMDASYAKNAGHWLVSNPYVEPYVTAGAPFQSIPDRGTGTEATGRYNRDDISAIMFNNNVGTSYGFTITDNWFRGGNYCLNAGGCASTPGQNFGSVLRNRFDHSQGAQSSGGDNTVTIALDTTWGASGLYNLGIGTADQNYYMDNGNPVHCRTNQ